ncbi:MAG: response regulator containing a CheY-like receiver domain and an HTH DNA-binding domain protein [Acidobacteria bacterium OLB17]|nr:MAG: response regulator containing a CheY-like receiver domain and an HTH DNA-binding domain protein [Acidobacteria bacterium OLB17]
MTKILLIERQPIVRLGIAAAVSRRADLELIAAVSDPQEGFRLFKSLRPDVVLLGLRFVDSCSIDALPAYFEIEPMAKVVILADNAGDGEIAKALKLGALAFVTKEESEDELLAAIDAAAKGKKYLPTEIAAVLAENYGADALTPAETKVLQAIVGGMSNKEIAFALDISENTVKSHIQNIFSKIGVSDRTSPLPPRSNAGWLGPTSRQIL